MKNNFNRRKLSPNSSKYKGVHWHCRTGKWRSAIGFEGRRISLGSFKSEIQAAIIYDLAAKRYHRQFAYLNFNENKSRFFAVRFKTSVSSVF